MIDWRNSSFTGSLRHLGLRAAKKHSKSSQTIRSLRYGFTQRMFRGLYRHSEFVWYFGVYFLVDIILVIVEGILDYHLPNLLDFSVPFTDELIRTITGYFIASQAGAIGVLSVALALVTIIAQRQDARTAIKIYYVESMAFQVVASSVALLAILSVQLVWPAQLLLHQLDLGSANLAFETLLVFVHLIWLASNLTALAYFLRITFKVSQEAEQEELRKSYIVNVLYRDKGVLADMYTEIAYNNSRAGFRFPSIEYSSNEPNIHFGFGLSSECDAEFSLNFGRPYILYDIRMSLVKWVFNRWSKRCKNRRGPIVNQDRNFGMRAPTLVILPRMNSTLFGNVCIWRLHGGEALTRIEKFVLRLSFRYRRKYDE